MDLLQEHTSNNLGAYIRCRNIDIKETKRNFVARQEKYNNKLAGWKARVLSQASKTIQVKLNLVGSPSFICRV